MAPQEEDQQIRPFAAVLQEMAGGRVHTRLSDQLRDLTAAVAETGKKGTLALVVEVKPLRPGDTGTLVVTAKTVLKAPEGDDASPVTVFFADQTGNLTRNDPRQLALPLREVSNGRTATA